MYSHTWCRRSELNPQAWISCLIRIAAKKFWRPAPEGAGDSPSSSRRRGSSIGGDSEFSFATKADEAKAGLVSAAHIATRGVSLAKALHMLLNLHVLPFARRTDADKFRKEISTPDMREVLVKHRNALVRVYAHCTWLVAGIGVIVLPADGVLCQTHNRTLSRPARAGTWTR